MSLHHKHFFSLFSRKFKVDSYDSLPIEKKINFA